MICETPPIDMGDKILNTLKQDEGFRSRAYLDSVGIWTIGYGTNLQVLEIDEPLATQFLNQGFMHAIDDACSLPVYQSLSPVRKGVLISMIYQMGLWGVKKFKKFLQALEQGDYDKAAEEMLDSKWAKEDSPARAKRHAARMRNDRWEDP